MKSTFLLALATFLSCLTGRAEAVPLGYELTDDLRIPFDNRLTASSGVRSDYSYLSIFGFDSRTDIPLFVEVPLNSKGELRPNTGTLNDVDNILFGDSDRPEINGRAIFFEYDPYAARINLLYALDQNLVNGDPFLYVEAVLAIKVDSPVTDLLNLGQVNATIDVFEGAVLADVSEVPIGNSLFLMLSAFALLLPMRWQFS